jgi:hypothetical protein
MGNWVNNVLRWNFVWSENLNAAESDDARELLLLLEQVSSRLDCRDSRRWIPHGAGVFSGKICIPDVAKQTRYSRA